MGVLPKYRLQDADGTFGFVLKRYVKQKRLCKRTAECQRGAAYAHYPGFVELAWDMCVMNTAFDLDLALVSAHCWGLILKVSPFLEFRYQKKGTQHQGQ